MPQRLSTPPLYDACVQQAQRELAMRLRELRGMRSSLAMLDALVQPLLQRGLEFYPSRMRWAPVQAWSMGRAIDVSVSHFMARQANVRLYDALVELGFREVGCSEHPTWCAVLLKRGALQLYISDLPQRTPQPGPSANQRIDGSPQA